MTPERRDALLKKIASLLALARAKNANPNEANAAIAQAQALMDRHRLTEAEAVKAGETSESVILDPEPLWSGAKIPRWRRLLIVVLASANGCVCYRETGRQQAMRVVGKPTSLAVVRYLFAYLSLVFTRERRRQHLATERAANSFYEYAVRAVAARLRPKAGEGEAAAAIVKDERASAQAHLESLFGKMRSAPHRSVDIDPAAAFLGARVGMRVDLGTEGKIDIAKPTLALPPRRS